MKLERNVKHGLQAIVLDDCHACAKAIHDISQAMKHRVCVFIWSTSTVRLSEFNLYNAVFILLHTKTVSAFVGRTSNAIARPFL